MINLDLVLCDFLGCGGGHVRFLCEGGDGVEWSDAWIVVELVVRVNRIITQDMVVY